MQQPGTGLTLADALGLYLQQGETGAQADLQQELSKFVRWCGGYRLVQQLTPPEMEDYASTIVNAAPADAERRLRVVRDFLAFLKKQKLLQANLAPHVKAARTARKGRAPARVANGQDSAPVLLTAQGVRQAREELERLHQERVRLAEEIRRAAADKDVRENAPLEAARERLGQVAARVRQIEVMLSSAVVIPAGTAQATDRRVQTGSRVELREMASGRQFVYTLVDPREAKPLDGRISIESPAGKALLDRREGEEVAVTAPRGVLHYYILKIE
ncbi:MAG: GreA/GreB family elongation factor [Chloroflexi bacterium]|nr:GreA/GreB family elongation factor [Chloroflexota bacterium]